MLCFDSLPMLTGVAGVDLRPGYQAESRQIQAGRAHRGIQSLAMFGLADLATVDLSVPQVLLTCTRQGALVTFAVENLELQLYRWRLIHDYSVRTGRAIASLDLSVTNNVPARWLETAVIPPARPHARKPSFYRKRHV